MLRGLHQVSRLCSTSHAGRQFRQTLRVLAAVTGHLTTADPDDEVLMDGYADYAEFSYWTVLFRHG